MEDANHRLRRLLGIEIDGKVWESIPLKVRTDERTFRYYFPNNSGPVSYVTEPKVTSVST
jgi:hypothetical protein